MKANQNNITSAILAMVAAIEAAGKAQAEANTEVIEFLKTIPSVKIAEKSTGEKLVTTWAFAKRTNQLEALKRPFENLGSWGQGRVQVFIWSDFAPHSFYFEEYPAGHSLEECRNAWQSLRMMNGGIIYHGPLEDGRHAETFSVELTPSNSWSIHT
jgi:hypothetical protein